MSKHNPVAAAKFAELTTRDTNRPARGQAHVACANKLLRWLHAVITTKTAGHPGIAVGQPADGDLGQAA